MHPFTSPHREALPCPVWLLQAPPVPVAVYRAPRTRLLRAVGAAVLFLLMAPVCARGEAPPPPDVGAAVASSPR